MTFRNSDKMPTTDDCEVTNAIRLLYQFYGRPDENRIRAYGDQLRGCNLKALNLACSHVINELKMFPSLSELKNLINVFNPKRKTTEQEDLLKFQQEQKRLFQLKEKFAEIIGLQYLSKYIKTWFIGVYGMNAYELIMQSEFDFSLWEKPAMFDLAEAQMSSENAIKIGKRKQLKIIEHLNKGR